MEKGQRQIGLSNGLKEVLDLDLDLGYRGTNVVILHYGMFYPTSTLIWYISLKVPTIVEKQNPCEQIQS